MSYRSNSAASVYTGHTPAIEGSARDARVRIVAEGPVAQIQSCAKVRHVLFVIDRLHSVSGGAEGALLKLCNELAREGYRLTVITLFAGEGVHNEFPCPVYEWRTSSIASRHAMSIIFRLARFVRKEKVDIIHTFFPASDILGGIAGKLAGRAAVISSRRDMGFLRTSKHKLAYKLVNRCFDRIQTVSESVRGYTIEHDGVRSDRVVTIHNAIDLARVDSAQRLEDLRRTLGFASRVPIITTVANLRAIKGIDVLIRAAASVSKDFPDAAFVVIGEAHSEAYKRELMSLATSLGVARQFRFLGSRSDVVPFLKSSDLFCLPSRSEGLSNALLEAMACGLPCVATDVGGNSELIASGKNGFLVPNEDSQALSARIRYLLRRPDIRLAMGRVSRSIVEQGFTLDKMKSRFVELYDDVLLSRQ